MTDLAENVISIGRFAVRTSTIQTVAGFFKSTTTAPSNVVAPGLPVVLH
jgi:hypothetical protein